MNILHLESSPREHESHSRHIAQELADALQKAHPDATIVFRDLNAPSIPHVTGDWVRGALYDLMGGKQRTPEQEAALRFSDELVAELQKADVIVLGTPMYNFGLPSVAKAYIDNVVRTGLTVNYGANGPEGQLKNKKLYAVTSFGGGGYGPGQARESINFVDGLIKTAFGFIGLTDITFVPVENMLASDDVRQTSLAKAREQIAQIVSAS